MPFGVIFVWRVRFAVVAPGLAGIGASELGSGGSGYRFPGQYTDSERSE